MSTREHIYIDAGEPIEVLAGRLSRVLGMTVIRNERGETFLSRPASNGDGNVGGELYPNHGTDPDASDDEISFTDNFRAVFEVGYTGRDSDVQPAEAARLFEELSSAALFRMALVRGFDILVAVSSPGIGTVMLPDGTTPYVQDRKAWLPYLPPAR